MNPFLTPRFTRAFELAHDLHRNQVRKGTSVPYISHLMSVCALVLENGGDEDQAIAALLHDAVEDQGGAALLDAIREEFGPRVARIIHDCSDAFEQPKPPWRLRKENHIAHAENTQADSLLVMLADKVHNARTLLLDYAQNGDNLFLRFKGGKEGTLWYYQAMAALFSRKLPGSLADELEQLVHTLVRVAAHTI